MLISLLFLVRAAVAERGARWVNEGVLMAEEPPLMDESGEIVFQFPRKGVGGIVDEVCMARSGDPVEGQGNVWGGANEMKEGEVEDRDLSSFFPFLSQGGRSLKDFHLGGKEGVGVRVRERNGDWKYQGEMAREVSTRISLPCQQDGGVGGEGVGTC
jgi:hypothetical protein